MRYAKLCQLRRELLVKSLHINVKSGGGRAVMYACRLKPDAAFYRLSFYGSCDFFQFVLKLLFIPDSLQGNRSSAYGTVKGICNLLKAAADASCAVSLFKSGIRVRVQDNRCSFDGIELCSVRQNNGNIGNHSLGFFLEHALCFRLSEARKRLVIKAESEGNAVL